MKARPLVQKVVKRWKTKWGQGTFSKILSCCLTVLSFVMEIITQTSLVTTVHMTKRIRVFRKQFCEIWDDRHLISHKAPGVQGRSVSKDTGGREFVKGVAIRSRSESEKYKSVKPLFYWWTTTWAFPLIFTLKWAPEEGMVSAMYAVLSLESHCLQVQVILQLIIPAQAWSHRLEH